MFFSSITSQCNKLEEEIKILQKEELGIHRQITSVDLDLRIKGLMAQLTESHLFLIQHPSLIDTNGAIKAFEFLEAMKLKITQIRTSSLDEYNDFISNLESLPTENGFKSFESSQKEQVKNDFYLIVVKTIKIFEKVMHKQHLLEDLEGLHSFLIEKRTEEIRETLKPEFDQRILEERENADVKKRFASIREDGEALWQTNQMIENERSQLEQLYTDSFNKDIQTTLNQELTQGAEQTSATLTALHLKAISTLLSSSEEKTLDALETLLTQQQASEREMTPLLKIVYLKKSPDLERELTKKQSDFDILCVHSVIQKQSLQTLGTDTERKIQICSNRLKELRNPGAVEAQKKDRWALCKEGLLEELKSAYKNKSVFDLRFINGYNAEGTTLLHIACSNNQIDIVNWLLEEGASVSQPDKSTGEYPIHLAAKKQNLRMVESLVKKEACVNKRQQGNALGHTTLHIAAANGSADIVTFLLDQGADPNTGNVNIETPLHRAVMANQAATVSLLLRHNKREKSATHTAISKAARDAYDQTIKKMKEINPKIRDNKGHTPFYYAVIHGFDDLLTLFLGPTFSLPSDRLDADYHLFMQPPHQKQEAIRQFLLMHGGRDHIKW